MTLLVFLWIFRICFPTIVFIQVIQTKSKLSAIWVVQIKMKELRKKKNSYGKDLEYPLRKYGLRRALNDSCGIDNQNSSISKGITWAKESRLWKTRWTLRTAGKQLAMLDRSKQQDTNRHFYIVLWFKFYICWNAWDILVCIMQNKTEKGESAKRSPSHPLWQGKQMGSLLDKNRFYSPVPLHDVGRSKEMCIIWSIYQGDVKGWCFSPENSV